MPPHDPHHPAPHHDGESADRQRPDVTRPDAGRHDGDEPRPGPIPLLADRLRPLAAAPDAAEAMRMAVAAVLEVVDGADCADVTVERDGTATSVAASDDLAAAIGTFQSRTDEGPCLSAMRDGQLVLVHDLAVDERWPRFSAGAVARGIRSVVAHPLYVDDGSTRHVYGALNVFGRRTEAMGGGLEAGAVVAAHCSLLLHAHAVREQLREAIATRDLIGQAKGVLMERHRVPAPTAFQMLRRASMDLNTKLHAVAAQVIDTIGTDEA